MTKAQSFDIFAVWINQLNPNLLLDALIFLKRIDCWKKKYLENKKFEEDTGAGIEEKSGTASLCDTLKEM